MTRGIVFDLQRFALHDGPGIRTTVFLKGCPLRCLWCHNPESQAFEPQPSVRRASASAGGAQPGEADEITVIGRTRTVEEVIAEVERDRPYYERSGGGLTLSGGEPLAQPGFALALLSEAHRRGLHTCLDTSGAVSARRMAATLPVTDLYLYDYKATDPDAHERLTGVRNALVLSNLALLYEAGAAIRLRCPLVPGVNDTRAHLEGIAALGARYPRLEGIEIMPYHAMGRAKAERVGRAYPLGDLPSASAEAVAGWLADLHGLGCARARAAA